ncbi:helix-turn-helix domain-containing protein [Paenibacillus aestuarii]|uniref:Helix-turn-helix transcriptional regulator n=1 Tax=Paenibacillus aestuarii TaxID=516965 RepID=A0ABW0K4T5_9BACL|nr:helix-turn-helix transcriptional regulator [Paenibacillus aestuarii]
MTLAIRIKLNEVLEAAKITKNALAREAKVRPNLIYDLCEEDKTKQTKRIDLKTLSTIIDTLEELTGKSYSISDILEYVSDKK